VSASPAVISLISPLAVQVSVGRLAPRTLAVLALAGANCIWGASAVASKSVLVHIPPMTLACLRVAVALAVLWPLVARNGARPTRGAAPAFLGLTGVALFCLLQNVGLRYASATNTALINGAIPVLTALLAAALLGEHLSGRRITGLLLSGGGVATVVLFGAGATLGDSVLGNLLPVAGAASFAAYAVLGRRTFASGDPLAIVAGSTRYGLLFLLPGAVLELATVGIGPVTMHDVLLLLYLGIGCSALAFVLCGYGLARLDAGQGAVFCNLKPLVGVVLAALLGESLTPGHLGGGALVLLGVLFASRNAGFARTGAGEGIFHWRKVWVPPWAHLSRPVATVDVEGLLRHVVGVGGSEEDRGAGDVLWLFDAAEGNRFDKLSLRFADLPTEELRELLVDFDPERRVDDPRRDAIDIDLVRGQSQCHRLRHADHAGLARAVGEHQRLPAATGLGSEVNDLAAAPLLDHLPRRRLRAPEHALAVDVEHEVPILVRGLQEGNDLADPCIVDEDIESAEALDSRIDHCLSLGLIPHVCLDRDGLTTRGRDLLGDAPRRVQIEIGDNYTGAFSGVRLADGLAHARPAAGDSRNLAFESHETSFVMRHCHNCGRIPLSQTVPIHGRLIQ
jgi:drug/metabolite transporter (DMT)-like permease